MNALILITGGTRSGKSAFAEKLAEEIYNSSIQKQKIAYIATGAPIDKEFKERIKKHKERRKDIFLTYEEEVYIDKKILEIYKKHQVFIIECMSTWLGNIYYKYKEDEIVIKSQDIIKRLITVILDGQKQEDVKNSFIKRVLKLEKKNFKNSIKKLLKINESDKILIFVTSETGLGIIPDNPMARSYRDNLGLLNQIVANSANFVYLLVSGQPLRIK